MSLFFFVWFDLSKPPLVVVFSQKTAKFRAYWIGKNYYWYSCQICLFTVLKEFILCIVAWNNKEIGSFDIPDMLWAVISYLDNKKNILSGFYGNVIFDSRKFMRQSKMCCYYKDIFWLIDSLL